MPTGTPRELSDWNLLRSFVAVVDTGTLTGAAERLGSTQPSVGRHIRTLEKSLGETLFVRQPGRLKPTAQGLALYEMAARMRDAAREISQGLDGDSPASAAAAKVSGVVRLTTGEVLGVKVLPALLAPLLHQHPQLELELVVSNTTENLRRREADIAVRFYRPTQDDVITSHLGQVEIGLYVRRDLLAGHQAPTSLDDAMRLAEHLPPIGYDQVPVDLAGLLRGPQPSAPLQFRLRTDAILAQHAAIEAGLGVGNHWVGLARLQPDLVRVLVDQVAVRLDVWLCAHDELRRSRRMRLVWDHLAAMLPPWLAAQAEGAEPGASSAASPRRGVAGATPTP
jgi:DNA-binding transcriptional LysR family regulator